MKGPLKHYIRECGARNKLRECTAVYSVTNSQGFVPSTDYFSKEVYSKDLTNYKIVKRGMIAYNPSRVNVGSLAVQNAEEQVVVSPLYVVISVDETQLLPEYLCYFLHSDIGLKEIAAHTAGSVRDSLKFSALQNIEITIRSVEEQRFIIRILQKVEALINKRRQTLNKLDDLVKSQFIEMFGNETNHVPLSHYISALEAGKSLAGKEDNVNKVLKTGAVSYDCFDETQVKNLPLDYMPLIEHRVNDGDILVSRMNTSELVGAAAYVWRAPSNTYIPDRLWRVKCRDCNPVFLWQLLIQPLTKRRIRQIASGTSGSMKNISKQDFLGINVICVGKDKQNQFAAFVEQTDKSKDIYGLEVAA